MKADQSLAIGKEFSHHKITRTGWELTAFRCDLEGIVAVRQF